MPRAVAVHADTLLLRFFATPPRHALMFALLSLRRHAALRLFCCHYAAAAMLPRYYADARYYCR